MTDIADIFFHDITNPLPARPKNAHKGMFGNVVVIGGDYGMPGAVRIAAEGALQVGAGLVTVLTRKEHISSVVTGRPELLCYGVDNKFALEPILKRANLVVLGPGLGTSDWSLDLFNKIIDLPVLKIIDADGLNLLANSSKKYKFNRPLRKLADASEIRHQAGAENQSVQLVHEDSSTALMPNFAESVEFPKRSNNWILTPHPGEASRLLDISTDDVQNFRVQALKNLHNKFGGVIVLKGHETLVGSADSIIRCMAGNPAMATPGMGDLLSGIIAGYAAQGLDLFTAAKYGVLLHGHAGDKALARLNKVSVLASDVLAEISGFYQKYSTP